MTKLRKHVNRSHIVNECEFCKKIFYDKAEFTKHKKTEHVEGKLNYFSVLISFRIYKVVSDRFSAILKLNFSMC